MGAASRLRSSRLPEKLQLIRKSFGLSQNEMISRLGLTAELIREELSVFERGVRQPPALVLLRYARCVGISTDVLLDDEMDLPAKLLKAAQGSAVRNKAASGRKRRQ
jgi:transcriptional regulator with XRE-family HTH domain